MKILIHPSFGIYLFSITVLSSLSVCVCVVAALLIHELCHYAACKILEEQIEQLEITPMGGVMTYKDGVSSSKGLRGVYVHAAGPIGNYAAILICCVALSHGIWDTAYLHNMIIANVSMLLVNLLPALPLDGGQILFCLGYYFFPVAKLAGCLSAMGIAIGFSGVLLALYGLISQGLLNCSLIIISIHMIVSAKRYQNILIAENLYAVLHERMGENKKIRKLIFYSISADEKLLNLIAYLKQNISVCFVFTEKDCAFELHEHDFCHALLNMANPTARQAYQNTLQYQEKVRKNIENHRFTP